MKQVREVIDTNEERNSVLELERLMAREGEMSVEDLAKINELRDKGQYLLRKNVS
jgi:phosphoribosylaminoimidazole-succinocarboxamide synthase